jgi:hypothetical protein
MSRDLGKSEYAKGKREKATLWVMSVVAFYIPSVADGELNQCYVGE